jgi:hypothetical protein
MIGSSTVDRVISRRMLWWVGSVVGLLAFVSTSAIAVAATAVSDLALLELLARLQRLLRNVVYQLGPIFLLAGLTLYFLSGKRSATSFRGHRLIVGGSVLFGIALAVDLLLELIAWVATHGTV